MAIIKDVTVKINNGTATLDAPVQFYEKDHDVELRFRLMDYKYKYDKDPQNILNSVDEDVLEAYTTIVNPRGYELEQINGVVKNDVVIFRLDPTYTDELDELGTYKLQIHIKCTHSEFTIPPITFEVLQRLKGIKVVTDGEDEVDNSEILDNSSKFVSDETGKLIIEWKKGDMISSAKLNAMVDVINDAVDEEKIRQENEIEREKKANNKIQELENTRVEYINKIDNELDSFDDQFDASMSDYETRFNALTVSQQQDAEVIDARDGEQTLRARLDRDIQKPSIIYEDVEGSYINVDTTCGYAQNVEILGNTIQNQNDLADIRSVGDKLENQELYEIPIVSCGKNLFSYDLYDYSTYSQLDSTYVLKEINLPVGTIVISIKKIKEQTSDMGNFVMQFWDNTTYNTSTRKSMINKGWGVSSKNIVTIEEGRKYYIAISISDSALSKEVILEKVKDMYEIQIEVGNTATPYEPYQGDKLTILSPVQLEKVGDVADRIICKDGVWGVEKNIETIRIDRTLSWGYTNDNTDYAFFHCPHQVPIKTQVQISNLFPCINITTGSLGESLILYTSNILRLKIHNSKLSEVSLEGFKKWLDDNMLYVKYQTTKPTFIPLPHDQQIKLRTFANKTIISFQCEIEPILKASVPKSIGASMNSHSEQIDNLTKELEKINNLEETVTSEVVSESDFITVENTNNGYFEDVKLEGRTLVNHMRNWKVKIGTLPTITNGSFTNDFVENNAYMYCEIKTGISTLICDVDTDDGEGLVISLTSSFSDIGANFLSREVVKGHFTKILDIPSEAKYLVVQRRNQDTGIATVKNLMLLEGDHSQNPPEYFEGIKSVGQDVEEISVLSTNNRCYDNTFVLGMLSSSTGDFATSTSSHDWCSLKNYINVKSSGKYFVSLENADNIATRIGVFFYNNNSYLYMIDINNNDYISIPSNANAIKIRYLKLEGSSNNIYNFNILISENDTKLKQDKKRILYYNDETQTWEKPILRQWDSIEKHSDGKYYYHKRSGEVVLNGSESGWKLISNSNNTTRFNIPIIDCTVNNKAGVICDKFNYVVYVDSECVWLGNNSPSSLNLAINNSKLSTQDVAGFKAWLQANPTTVVYQLAQEQVYECTDLDLITYADETNLMVKGGAIVPKTTLKVHQNIANIATILQEKVNVLENNVGHVTEVFVDSKIEPINSEIGNINNEIGNINSEIGNINNEIGNINNEIGNINNEIGNINNDLTSLTESIEGSCISVDSKDGYLKDVEIIGNTIQNQNDLTDIRSVGDKLENQELYEIPVLINNENLFDKTQPFNEVFADVAYDKPVKYDFENDLLVTQGKHSVANSFSQKHKLKPNTTYSFYAESVGTTHRISVKDNGERIGESSADTQHIVKCTFTTKTGDVRITYLMANENPTGLYGLKNISLVEGDIPKKVDRIEDKLTILSPAPLEKVGDVADRIVCKDGVWGVEKNIGTKTLDGSMIKISSWRNDETATGCLFEYMDDVANGDELSILVCCDKLMGCAYIDLYNYAEGISGYTNNNYSFTARINNSKLNGLTIIEYFNQNPLTVKYQLAQPTFIPLPYDQQVKLRTFANKTNIHFLTEIEPTLKASVPKSIGASVSSNTTQIDNLSKELEKINNLEESTASTITTESDFTTVEATSNGYFDDVKLEGRTLVNLYPKLDYRNYASLSVGLSDDTIRIDADGNWRNFTIKKDVLLLKTSTYYTFVINIIENTIEGDNPTIHFGDTLREDPSKFSGAHALFLNGKKGIYTFKLKTKDSFDNISLDTRDHLVNTATGGTIVFKYMILEGDHTQNPPEFFEGIKSVGQDVDEISVLSANENLFDGIFESGDINSTIGTDEGNIERKRSNYIEIEPNNAISFNIIPLRVVFYDSNKQFILFANMKQTYTTPANCKYIRFSVANAVNDVMLVYSSKPKSYKPHNQDKKHILYYNDETQTWEKPVLREWDSIEKHSDGKYYYHKRSGEVVLNGSENWHRGGSSDSKTITSYFGYDIPNNVDKNYVCCDNFPRIDLDASLGDYELEGARNSSGNIYININKARLSEDNLVGFKAWLQANPTTVVYQLAEEKVYECTNLDLITYENETNLVVKSGVLNPKVSLKVSKGVGNVVSTLQNKVTMLEQMIYNLMKMLNIQQSNIDE